MEDNKVKILLDTDAGDDIDDALAIALGLSSREVEFVGITTVFKNTADRAKLVKKLVRSAGKDIPVYAGRCGGYEVPTDPYGGYPNGIIGADGKTHMCQYTSDLESPEFAPVNADEGYDGYGGVDFIIECCRKYGKDLTIVAIGPFTNIAEVIRRDPDALNLAKRVVIMGGAFYMDFPEWNIRCDVEAAKLLFSGAVKNLECVGLDVTLKTELRDDEADIMRNYRGKEYTEYASRLVRIWMEHNKGKNPILHDPLALYYCICPSILEMVEMNVYVVTDGDKKAYTLDADKVGKVGGKVMVAKSLDRERFVKDYLERVFS